MRTLGGYARKWVEHPKGAQAAELKPQKMKALGGKVRLPSGEETKLGYLFGRRSSISTDRKDTRAPNVRSPPDRKADVIGQLEHGNKDEDQHQQAAGSLAKQTDTPHVRRPQWVLRGQ